MRLGPAVFGALVCLGFGTGHALAQQTVLLDLPDNVPLGISTIVPGELVGEPIAGSTFELSHRRLGDQKLLGQCDESGKRMWIALTTTKQLLGSSIRLHATEIENQYTELPDDRLMRAARQHGGYAFKDRGRVALFYQSDPLTRHNHTRAGFVHRLVGMNDETLTEIFPEDHRHHQGVFWAWHQLWVGGRKIGDPWITKDHLVVPQTISVKNWGRLFTDLFVTAHWTSPLLAGEDGKPLPIVSEQTMIRLFRAGENVQYVDFIIRLLPLMENVKIGGSENAKGYSGFTVRVKPPKDMVIRDASGIRESDAVQTASPWADVYGSFARGKTSGVAILSHPSLAQFPPRWLLRHYGMQNVAYPGREPVALSAVKPLVIRHRLVLHRGNTAEARIADHQRVYELTP